MDSLSFYRHTMHRIAHLFNKRSIFFNGISHHNYISACFAIQIGFLRLKNTPANDKMDIFLAKKFEILNESVQLLLNPVSNTNR